jgi:hypothetical protein
LLAPDADDLGGCDGSKQLSGAEGQRLEGEGREVERGSRSPAVGEMKGQVFFRGRDQIDDPKFTAAIFHGAVVGTVIN